jgi:hypothetical protein
VGAAVQIGMHYPVEAYGEGRLYPPVRRVDSETHTLPAFSQLPSGADYLAGPD